MLSKINRLPSSRFTLVKSQGRLIQSPLFGLIVYPNQSHQSVRFGFIVSTKISPQATVRNRLRRLLSESLRPLLSHLKPGHDFIVLAKPRLINQPFSSISQTFNEILTPYFN